MNSITYVGMDVHTSNYTLCCYTIEEEAVFGIVKVEPEVENIIKYLKQIEKQRGETHFICGYEAGCLGYSLYRELADKGVDCIILAPSTMAYVQGKRIKTDKRDAENIARCLAYHQYKPVYVPDEEDDAIKEYIRMRNDIKQQFKSLKQQIIAYCTRHGFIYDGKTYWTERHLKWLDGLNFANDVYRETLYEYLVNYYTLLERIEIYDKRIEEFSQKDRYRENVSKLLCFSGISINTAMSFLTEVGDFNRFNSAQRFSAYLGLVPGEDSSSDRINRLSITKAGNSHLRKLLVEASQHYARGQVGKKSKILAEKQKGNPRDVIEYADKANERLKRKFYKIALRSKHNIAKTAVARELACFIWGMMTNNYSAIS